MSRFMSRRFAGLTAYTPGEQPQDRSYVKLNTNESPFPPCPEVTAAAAAEAERLHLYPDPTGHALKEKLAEYYGLEPAQVFLANGSDDILNFSFMAFCDEERPAVFPDISYGFYPVYADLYGIPHRVIPLKEDFTIDPAEYCAAKGMIVIANPNAPTGLTLTPAQIRQMLESDPERVVLIDEAYVDFGAESCVPLIREYPNLLVVQTFSKSRSMAGARLGYALAQPELIEDLEKIKYSTNPYSINRMTLAAGTAALEHQDYFTENCRKIGENRARTAVQLRDMGFTLTDSLANFLFVRPPKGSGRDYYLGLKERGVLVRYFGTERIRDYVRVTVGDAAQMETFLRETKAYLESLPEA